MKRYAQVLALMLVLAAPVVGSAQPSPSIMRLADVKPGMRGIGKTVVFGQQVDEFQFDVMDILQSGGGPVGVLEDGEGLFHPLSPDQIGHQSGLRRRNPNKARHRLRLHDALHAISTPWTARCASRGP